MLLDKPLNVGATVYQFAEELAWRELALNLRPPVTVGNASKLSGLPDCEIVFLVEGHGASFLSSTAESTRRIRLRSSLREYPPMLW